MKPGFILVDIKDLPVEPGWLFRQAGPVIAIGPDVSTSVAANADVILPDQEAAASLIENIEQFPVAALVLVQVLRATEGMDIHSGLKVESLAYSMLQTSLEYQRWLRARKDPPQHIVGNDQAILIEREGDIVRATLNRPENRNSLTVEMRDALIELFQLIDIDDSISRLELRGAGSCFCVGGELREFGLSNDASQAHSIRSSHNPSALMAAISQRTHCFLHSACLGSGIELPAFAGKLTATRKAFFQLPELSFGLIPGAGGCISIARRIGRHRTSWMVLSGKKINAETALEWGLVDEIVE